MGVERPDVDRLIAALDNPNLFDDAREAAIVLREMQVALRAVEERAKALTKAAQRYVDLCTGKALLGYGSVGEVDLAAAFRTLQNALAAQKGDV